MTGFSQYNHERDGIPVLGVNVGKPPTTSAPEDPGDRSHDGGDSQCVGPGRRPPRGAATRRTTDAARSSGEADSGCVPRLPVTPRPHAEGAGRCKTLHFRGNTMSLLFNRIRQARRGAEMSQSELANIVGVARRAVAQWERRDGAKPTTDNMAKIAMATVVSFDTSWIA